MVRLEPFPAPLEVLVRGPEDHVHDRDPAVQSVEAFEHPVVVVVLEGVRGKGDRVAGMLAEDTRLAKLPNASRT